MKKISIFLILCVLASIFASAAPRRKNTRRRATPRRSVRRTPPKPVKLTQHDANPFKACEDTCAHMHGIDVSHYQFTIGWDDIYDNSNMGYVYLKCTEGSDNQDPYYKRNIELAGQKIKVGSYHFFRPKVSCHDQLKNFTNNCLIAEQDLIPMLDVETTANMPTQQFCDSLTKMLRLMEEAYHQKPLVYTYRNFYNKHLQGRIEGYPLMIAMYSDNEPELADGRDYLIWQYTAHGRIAGVKGDVDKSRFVGNHTIDEIKLLR